MPIDFALGQRTGFFAMIIENWFEFVQSRSQSRLAAKEIRVVIANRFHVFPNQAAGKIMFASRDAMVVFYPARNVFLTLL